MKLFKRRNKDEESDLDINQTYDSDEDSIPPPPPLPPMSGSTDIVNSNNEEVTVVSSVKASNEEFYDNKSLSTAERSSFINSPNLDDVNGSPVIRAEDTSSKRGGYSSVPITGQFRGMKNAQTFDEEEAGMDEIEVPSSSVVDRWNEWEKKYALRKKLKMAAMIVLGVIVVIVGVSLGSVFGTRGDRGGVDSNENEGSVGDNEPGLGGAAAYPTHMDTPSGRILWDDANLPSSTRTSLQEQDEDSAAYKAWKWIESDDANQGYNFDMEDVNDKTKLDLVQRFALASIFHTVEGGIDGWMTADGVCDWDGVICLNGGEEGEDGGARRRKLVNKERRKVQEEEGGDDLLVNERIRAISLANQDIEGPIPVEFGLLSDLNNIALYGNFFNGEIPDEIFSLQKLEILDLYDNDLTGSISPKIGNLKSLVGLYIGRNGFTGELPDQLYELDGLVALWMDNLQGLDGQALPADIGNLQNLGELKISGSQFEGNLPEEIGSLVSLIEFSADRNGFEGEIPDIGALVNLGKAAKIVCFEIYSNSNASHVWLLFIFFP